jgi:hypothetical protein
VRIKRIVDSYRQTRTQVCDELGGQRIRPAASIACTFVLEDYAPPRFDSVANIVDVRVTDQSSGRRASGSDLSTVTTLNNGGDRVLGATTTSPNTEGAGTTASTGFDLMPVSALAALLLASGAGLVRLGEGPVRARRKHREKEKRAGRIPARSAGF